MTIQTRDQTSTPLDAAAQIRALLGQHGLTAASAAVAYFALDAPESFIGAHDPDGRVTPLIGFAPLPVRGVDLLTGIAGIDDNAARLVANYRRAFPAIVERVSAVGADLAPVESPTLGWLLSAASLLLWLEEEDLARALQPLDHGVKVDTVVIEQDGGHVVDGRRLLRSLMSYRLADVPKHVLARSVFESLGDFVADAVRRLLREWRAEAVVCAGDLFARNRPLRDRTRRSLVLLRLPVLLPEG